MLLLALSPIVRVHGQPQSSVLATGTWHAVSVESRGVYKITYDDFRKMGFNVPINANHIKVFGNVGGMLPQALNISRPFELERMRFFFFFQMKHSIRETIYCSLPKDRISFNMM